jgi:hypothetical protein
MPSTVSAWRAVLLVVLVELAPVRPAPAQGSEPLRKTELIRLLTGNTMTPAQIASLVQRNCLSFTPTARDRQNLIQLGADSTILARIEGCARAARARAAAPRPAPTPAAPVEPPAPLAPPGLVAVPLTTRIAVPAGGTASVGVALKRGTTAVSGTRLVLRGSGRLSGADTDAEAVTDERGIALFRFPVGSRAGTVQLSAATVEGEGLSAPAEIELATFVPAPPPPPPAPIAPRPGPERTGFASGMGQRGRVGETAALPVVFEVRDSNGSALVGFPVTLTIVNGRLVGALSATDSLGQVRAQVVFGDRAGAPTVITGTAGAIVRQTMLYPAPGAPSQLVVLLDGNALVGQVVFQSGRVATLRIFCRDAVGNSVPLAAVSAATGDERLLRVTGVTSDSLGGSVTVTAARAGNTTLVIRGTGLLAEFSALVRR